MEQSSSESRVCPRCSAKLTKEDLYNMFPNFKKHIEKYGKIFHKNEKDNLDAPTFTDVEAFVKALNDNMKKYKINTCRTKSYFLTHLAKETGQFMYSIEKISESKANKNYADVAGNGNEASGDGYKYRGRGLIQITRKNGYKRFGKAIGKGEDYFVNNPKKMV